MDNAAEVRTADASRLFGVVDETSRPSTVYTVHATKRFIHPRWVALCGDQRERWGKTAVTSFSLAERDERAHFVSVGFVARHDVLDFVPGVHDRCMVFLAELASDLG